MIKTPIFVAMISSQIQVLRRGCKFCLGFCWRYWISDVNARCSVCTPCWSPHASSTVGLLFSGCHPVGYVSFSAANIDGRLRKLDIPQLHLWLVTLLLLSRWGKVKSSPVQGHYVASALQNWKVGSAIRSHHATGSCPSLCVGSQIAPPSIEVSSITTGCFTSIELKALYVLFSRKMPPTATHQTTTIAASKSCNSILFWMLCDGADTLYSGQINSILDGWLHVYFKIYNLYVYSSCYDQLYYMLQSAVPRGTLHANNCKFETCELDMATWNVCGH